MGDSSYSRFQAPQEIRDLLLQLLSHLDWPARLALRSANASWKQALARPLAELFADWWLSEKAPGATNQRRCESLFGDRSTPPIRAWLRKEGTQFWRGRHARAFDAYALWHLCRGGHLADAKKLMERFALSASDVSHKALRDACGGRSNDHLRVVRWLVDELGLPPPGASAEAASLEKIALTRACDREDWEGARWAATAFERPGRTSVTWGRYALISACSAGRAEEAKFFAEKGGLAPGSSAHTKGFRAACARGHLEVARWLDAEGGLPPPPSSERAAALLGALRKACINGHLEVAQWLGVPPGLSAAPSARAFHKLLVGVCANGHLDVVKWFVGASGKPAADLDPNSQALRRAFARGHLEVVRYLKKVLARGGCTFALRLSDLRAARDNGHPEMVEWAAAALGLHLGEP